jgi:putative Ca2+/H+ antiporter (TMEM165/GDT1 family)
VEAFLVSTAIATLAETGDTSQLLVLALVVVALLEVVR